MLASDSRPAPPPSLNSFPTAPHYLPNDGGGRRRPGPRQPRPGAPAPRPPAEVQPVFSVRSRGGGGGSPPKACRDQRGRGTEPKPGGGGARGGGRASPGERGPAGAGGCALRCVAGAACSKSSWQARGVCSGLGARCGNAAWLGSPRSGGFVFTPLKKSATKTNKRTRAAKGCNPRAPVVESGRWQDIPAVQEIKHNYQRKYSSAASLLK